MYDYYDDETDDFDDLAAAKSLRSWIAGAAVFLLILAAMLLFVNWFWSLLLGVAGVFAGLLVYATGSPNSSA